MSTTKGIWVLTEGYNDYDQHGEYFLMAWLAKPTRDDLLKEGILEHDLIHVLNGGGRRENEYSWYLLNEQD